MRTQSGFSVFTGMLVALLADVFTIAVGAYFYYTFWLGQTVDLKLIVADKAIPPESYPILLLAIWSLAQRAKAHLRPQNTFWWWEDAIFAWAAVALAVFTMARAFTMQTNLSFLFVIVAFVIVAFGDALFNGRHRYESEGEDVGAGQGSTTGSGTGASSQGALDVPVRMIVVDFVWALGRVAANTVRPTPIIEHRVAPAIRQSEQPSGDVPRAAEGRVEEETARQA